MPTEWQRYQRNLSSARREIIKAVERSSAVDLRPGHVAEARRRTRAILDEVDKLDKLLRALEEGDS